MVPGDPWPLLAAFALRVAGGLAVVPWALRREEIPSTFFRLLALVTLGALVVAALELGRVGASQTVLIGAISAAVVAYFGSIAWGLGLCGVGQACAGVVLVLAMGMAMLPTAAGSPVWQGLALASVPASALLLGSVLGAMLLGHHYLTAPAMSIEPLQRLIRLAILALVGRAVLAAPALVAWLSGSVGSTTSGSLVPLLLGLRWGFGILGVGVSLGLARETARIRSTQSATGILYIGAVLALFGELTALLLAREAALTF